jgi:hypothetical protein
MFPAAQQVPKSLRGRDRNDEKEEKARQNNNIMTDGTE